MDGRGGGEIGEGRRRRQKCGKYGIKMCEEGDI
jgi:hypothetical protein